MNTKGIKILNNGTTTSLISMYKSLKNMACYYFAL
jgi:hypothetical protein